MIGRPFTDFQKPEIARRDAEIAATIQDGQIHQRYETEALRRDGSTVILSFNSAILRDPRATWWAPPAPLAT